MLAGLQVGVALRLPASDPSPEHPLAGCSLDQCTFGRSFLASHRKCDAGHLEKMAAVMSFNNDKHHLTGIERCRGTDEDRAMADTNVIEFAPALQRRRKRQTDHAAYTSRYGPWRSRYGEGIDGLWPERQAWKSPGEVTRLVTPRKRLAAEG